MVASDFSEDGALDEWTYYPAAWKLDEPACAETRPARTGRAGELRVEPGTRWSSPVFPCEPGAYYRLRFRARSTSDRECWGAMYFDAAGRALAADTYGSIDASEAGAERVVVFRPTEGAATAQVTFFGVQSPLGIDEVSVDRIPEEEALAWTDALYAEVPPVAVIPPAVGMDRLPRTRQAFREGGRLRVVMLGDSIINDTQNGLFELLLHRRFPGLRLQIVPSVRGATHCWYYGEPEHFAAYVTERRPELLIVGGISHREQIEPIRRVIRKALSEAGCEVLLMSGPMGEDRRPSGETGVAGATVSAPDPSPRAFDLLLRDLALEEGAAFMDMGTAWQVYLVGSGAPHGWFHRDRIHANDRGKQILSRLVERFFAEGLPQGATGSRQNLPRAGGLPSRPPVRAE